jgi:hypothetical protein
VVFPSEHNLLTVGGTSYNGVETWSFGVRFGATVHTDPTQAMADACRAATQTFWNTAGIFMPSSHVLTFTKVAPIGPDGKYPSGKIAYTGAITPDAGPSNTNIHPAQCTQVVTWLTSFQPRGRGSRGRIYLPCPAAAVSAADGTNSLGSALANAATTWIQAMNAISGLGVARIMSNIGAGIENNITQVRADSLPDTQRRRRRQLTSTTTTVNV